MTRLSVGITFLCSLLPSNLTSLCPRSDVSMCQTHVFVLYRIWDGNWTVSH